MAKNKLDQAKRRELRKAAQVFVKDQYTILGEIVKPRPKFVPQWLWRWGARIFLDIPKLQRYMMEGLEPKAKRQSTE